MSMQRFVIRGRYSGSVWRECLAIERRDGYWTYLTTDANGRPKWFEEFEIEMAGMDYAGSRIDRPTDEG